MSDDGLQIPVSTPGGPEAMAVLNRIADAVEKMGQKTEATAEKTSRLSSAFTAVGNAAHHFNSIRAAVSAVSSAINDAATAVTDLATEQAQLDATSRRLGLNFDDMADAAGRFTDETQAMGVATTLAAHHVRLSQQQSENLMRAIGAASIRQNISMEQASESALQAIIRGRVRGLEPYGHAAEQLAGSAHTANERMMAIAATAGTVERATDTAADQVERLRDAFDDSKRAVAAAFVNELAALQHVTSSAHDAGEETRDLGRTFTTVGETIATAMARAVIGVQMLGRAAQIVVGGIGAAANAIGAAATTSGGPAARLAALRAAFAESSSTGMLGSGMREMGNLTDQGNAIDERVRDRDAARAAENTPAAIYRRRLDAALAAADAAVRPDRPGDDEGTRSGGRSGPALFQQTDETRRASAIALAEKQAREEAAYQAFVARAPQDAANDNAARARNATAGAAEHDRIEEARRANQERLRTKADEDAQRERAGSMRGYLEDQANSTVRLRDVTVGAFDAMGAAATSHFDALIGGSESASQALAGFVHDSMAGLAKIAAQQAVFEFGKGFAALFTVPAAAPAHFAAAALFGVAAAAAGGIAQATAPAAASAGGGRAAAGGEQRAARVSPQRADRAGDSGPVVVNNFYSPVVGGHTASEGETGMHINRMTNVERRRTNRAA